MTTTNSNRVKLELEYQIHSSIPILFQQFSTPSGLESWFADHVSVKDKIYHFKWNDGTEAICELVKEVNNKLVKFKYLNAPADEYLEIKIVPDELSDDLELQITEFTTVDEAEELADIWDSSIDSLCKIIGA